MTPFERLRDSLILSGDPVATGTPDGWERVFQRLGQRLPTDYVQFVSTFGHCVIDECHLRVLNPFADDGGFWGEVEREVSIDLEDIAVSTPDNPWSSYRRPKGMIPWGSTGDGGSYLWMTDDLDVERWTVFVEWDLSSAPYDLGLEAFLLAGLGHQLDAFAFGEGFPESVPVYLDPVVPLASASVEFDRRFHWSVHEVELLRHVFKLPHGNAVRPQRWHLNWTPGHLSVDMLPEDIDAPKRQVAALAEALGVRIVSARPASWADLVG